MSMLSVLRARGHHLETTPRPDFDFDGSSGRLGLSLAFTGCAERNVHATLRYEARSIEPDFVDLQAGWRLRVVTPILKSGGYRLQSLESTGGSSHSFAAGPDFVGYENGYYAVTGNGKGIRVEFRSAEIVIDGKTARQPRPRAALFDLPANLRRVRLIYLVRVSQTDHDLAIVGADEPETLASTTDRVQANPDKGCLEEVCSTCLWVPVGIAISPEERVIVNGKKEWAPARLH